MDIEFWKTGWYKVGAFLLGALFYVYYIGKGVGEIKTQVKANGTSLENLNDKFESHLEAHARGDYAGL